MNTKTKNVTFKLGLLLAYIYLLAACGGGGDGGGVGDGGGGGGGNQAGSNPDFVVKANAVKFNQIKLYPGHIDADNRPSVELDHTNLNSGALITIEVELDINAEVDDYALSAHLVPEIVFDQLKPGNTLGDIIDQATVPSQGIEITDLGGGYIDNFAPGTVQGFIHAKLPVLQDDSVFKIAITPSLTFLSSGEEINDPEVEDVPILIDDRVLTINKLDQVAAVLKKTPDLAADNDFTELEIGGAIGANGFTVEPVFQTSIEVDLTTFNESEDIVLALTYTPIGGSLPMALLSSDVDGNPVISERASFKVSKTGVTSVTLPLAAYASSAAQTQLLADATHIRDIADQQPAIGNFKLEVFYLDNGGEVSAGPPYDLSLPLVSQDNRFLSLSPEEAIGFAVLRAGATNNFCLQIPSTAFDVDTGELSAAPGAIAEVIASTCPAPGSTTPSRSFWRYDVATQQIISKKTDADGENHCLTWTDKPVNPGSFFPNDFNLVKCDYKDNPPTTAVDSQRFVFEGQKIKLDIAGIYIDVVSGDVTATQGSSGVASFSRDTNGVEIDQQGRLFHVEKYYDRSWGSASLAQVNLSYGGESYLDYMPVIGNTSEGHVNLNIGLFGAVSSNLLDAQFTLKRYLPKKTSFSGTNTPDAKVGIGSRLSLDFFGLRIFEEGEIKETKITQTFNAADLGGNLVVPDFVNIEKDLVERKVSLEFVQQVVIIAVVPVQITGGVEGTLDMGFALKTPGLGVEAKVTQDLKLSGFVEAKVLTAGIEGKVEALNQKLTFSANTGFITEDLAPKLEFNTGSSLVAELNLLKGKVTAFVEYPVACWCSPPWKLKEKKKVIYESDYLFNKKWEIFNKELNAIVIEF